MLVLALIALVIVVDQAAKWWAWRHFSWTRINSGGDVLVGATIGAWYAGRVTGALLDLLDVGLLSLAVTVLARWRAGAVVVAPGALMIGGWTSNLLDRLGMHYLTAPGSVRGAVDFIHLGGYFYNIADLIIIGCTPLFLLAAGYEGVRAAIRYLPPLERVALRSGAWARIRVPALACAPLALALVVTTALGAANYGGVTAPPPHAPTRKATSAQTRPLRSRSVPAPAATTAATGAPGGG